MLEIFLTKTPILLDGAIGTELIKGGMNPGKSTISQNLEAPELVLRVHRDYVDAGSQAITSNTFAGNRAAMAKSGLADKAEACNLRGMELAKSAAVGKVKVAAGMGPTGEFYRHFDSVQVEEVFFAQAQYLCAGEPDFFLLETMFDIREALAALRGVKRAAGGVPAAVTMTFNRTPRGFFTVMGDEAQESLAALEAAGADAVGANCSLVPGDMLELTDTVRSAVSVPLIMQPNAGQPEISGDEIIYRCSPGKFTEGLVKLAEAGADIVGGCCGSTPEMIALTAKRLKALHC